MKHNGYTLQELIIIIALIGIVGVIVAKAFTNEADASTTSWPIPTFLQNQSAQFIYSNDGNLTIFNMGKATWMSADEVCAELKPLDANLKHVTLIPVTWRETEMVWNEDQTKLITLDGRDEVEADCN